MTNNIHVLVRDTNDVYRVKSQISSRSARANALIE